VRSAIIRHSDSPIFGQNTPRLATSPVIRWLGSADYALFAIAQFLLPLLALLNSRRFAPCSRKAIRTIRS
jgi:hypothetical protein